MLTQRALVLFKLEDTPNVDANPTQSSDAVLVESPEFQMDPNVLERKFVHPDLSPIPHLVGRKLAKLSFTAELRGNGQGSTGLVGNLPKVATLMQACGFVPTALDTAACCLVPMPSLDNSHTEPTISWAHALTTPPSWAGPVLYKLTVVLGGVSATATMAVTSTNPDIDATDTTGSEAVVTSGSPITLGTSTATVTPTWTGSLVAGSVYYVLVLPKCVKVAPSSTAFKTGTCYAYFDGLLHKVPGCLGTFKVSADAGAYAKITFDFIGVYVTPIDSALPTSPVYEDTLPAVVQTSGFSWGGNNTLVAAQWTFDMANKVVQRPDINSTDGYRGSRITSRTPTGGFNPEATTVSTSATDVNPFDDFASSRQKTFLVQAGNTAGNIVAIYGPRCQVSGMKYADREGIRVYDNTIKFTRYQGDDEVVFYFM